MKRFVSIALLCLFAVATGTQAAPETFSQAKRLMREHVYMDQNQSQRGSFYCGCRWDWVGKSGGRIDLGSCGFQTSKMVDRAERLEWEHILPISAAGQHRQCWRNGGRKNCQRTDPVFNRMEADMFNLTVSIGAANALRSNIGFGMVTGSYEPLGACATKISTTARVVEPRAEAKGMAARTTFYFADRYNVRLSEQQQRVLMAWDRAYPVTEWELERDRRIAYSMGHHNPFVTGERQWVPGYKPRGEGLTTQGQQRASAIQPRTMQAKASMPGSGLIHGNKRSGVYHLPQGCPSYNMMSESNLVVFSSEAEAVSAGFRKAGNCK